MILNVLMGNGDKHKYIVDKDVISTIRSGDPGVTFITTSDDQGCSISKKRKIFIPYTFVVNLEMEDVK